MDNILPIIMNNIVPELLVIIKGLGVSCNVGLSWKNYWIS